MNHQKHMEAKQKPLFEKGNDTRKISYRSPYRVEKKGLAQKTRTDIFELRKENIRSADDIASAGDASRFIEKEGDAFMRKLENELGYDSIRKLIFLTGCYTVVEVGKGFSQILKIGEGTVTSVLDLSSMTRKEYEDFRAIMQAMRGVGIDALNVLSLIPGIKALSQMSRISVPRISTVLKKAPISLPRDPFLKLVES